MKSESNIKPKELSVEQCAGNMAEIVFCENIKSEQRNEEIFYTYDEYRTAVPYRSNLFSIVEKSRDEWLERAKAEEAAALIYKPTLEENIAVLAAENARLREENDIISVALEETISIVLGG